MSIAGFFTGRDRYVRRRRSRGRGRRRPGRGGGDGPGPDPGLASAFLWADLDTGCAGVADFGGSGTNQYYLTDGPLIETSKTAYTIHVLFRPDAIGATLSLFDQRPLDGGTTRTAGRLRVTAAGVVEAIIRDGTNSAIVAASTGSASAGAWTLATLVRDGASLRCYRNGGSKGTAPAGTMAATPGGVAAIGGFRSGWPATDLFDGRILFVDILDGASSDAEVAAYHAALGTLGTQYPGAHASRINRLDLSAPVIRGTTDPSVVARAFGVPSFAAPPGEPGELRDPYNGLYALAFGGWTFPAASAPTYRHAPARLDGGGVMSGSKAGAFAIGSAAAADLGLQLSPGAPAATEQLYAEILPDGSGLTIARTSGDFVEAKLLAAGGSVSATVTSSDTLFGRRAVATATATNVDAWFSGAVSSTPVTRMELGLADPDGCLLLAEGHKFVLDGDATYTGEYAVSAVDPAAGWVRFVVPGHDAPAPSTSGVYLRSVGENEHTPASGDAPRYAALRVRIDGDAVAFFSRGVAIGSGTLTGLSGLSATGVTRYLGTHAGSPDAAPTSALAGFGEAAGLTESETAEFDARLGWFALRRDGWGADHAAMWCGDMPGVWMPSYIEEERETTIHGPDGTLIGDGWAHDTTGQGYGRSNGVAVLRDVGALDLAETTTYAVRHTLFRRAFGYADEALDPELIYSGPVAELRRRPLTEWPWQNFYVDPTAGSDSNAGTEASPFATAGPAMRRWGPHTAVHFKRGESHTGMGGLTASGYPDLDDLGLSCQGPIRFETYGPAGRAALAWSSGTRSLDMAGGYGFRLGPGFSMTKPITAGSILDYAFVDAYFSNSGVDCLNVTRCRGVLIDLFESDPAVTTAYQIFVNNAHNSWLLGVVRPLFGSPVGDGSHVLRVQGAVGYELALVRPRTSGIAADASTKNFELRHGVKGAVVTDIDEDVRKLASSADADANAVHANVRYESIRTPNADLVPCSGAFVGHFVQAGTVGTPNFTNLAGGEHKLGARRARALATRTRTGGTGAWSRATHEPTAGAFANADASGGDFGAVAMPGVALAEAGPDGSVALLADGHPLGGGTGLVALRWRRSADGGSTWEAVPGSGRRVSSDRPGPGTYLYSTYTGSDPGSPDAAGASSDPVVVA